ncbi:MAG: YggN family protein [Pseudomonadota bacterium]|nr:YggN family protein [Pseudomonadota bacterium]
MKTFAMKMFDMKSFAMNKSHRIAGAVLLLLPLLAGCQPDSTPPATEDAASPSASEGPRTALGRTVDKALREAREKMATENIDINGDMGIRIGNSNVSRRAAKDAQGNPLPEAAISPVGDLLIDGVQVPIDEAQRALLLQYRGHVMEMIEVGMSLGVKGADLGMQAAGEALRGVFRGQTDGFEQRINAEADRIEAEAMQLCDRLPAMLATQRQLADALPAFRPYATMTEQDVDDCRSEDRRSETRRAQARDDIRSGIRQSIRAATPRGKTAASEAEEAEAATR